MLDLLASAIKAHGGIDRWRDYSTVKATLVSGGELLDRKAPQKPEPRQMTVSTREQVASVTPFGGPDRCTRYTPSRIAIETTDGKLLSERTNPREAFAGHDLDTPWDPLHRAYFNGYTQWIYLNAPFMLTLPGLRVEEAEPLRESGETWRALRVTLPPNIASHSVVQTFYFGDDFLMRRHDYNLDVAGGQNIAHYTHDVTESDGLLLARRRRAFLCDEDYNVLPDRLLIWIDYSEIRFSSLVQKSRSSRANNYDAHFALRVQTFDAILEFSFYDFLWNPRSLKMDAQSSA